MEMFENSENKEFDINLVDFPFICRICLKGGDLRLFEEEDYLLDLYETITKIDFFQDYNQYILLNFAKDEVRSTANLPKNVCNDCIKSLEDLSLFIDISRCNDLARQEKNLLKKENAAVDNCGTSQGFVTKSEKVSGECEDDINMKESEMCRICSLTSCLTLSEEKAHLMQLFQNITNIDVEAETKFSKRNSICKKCINELEKISLFISVSFCNDMKLKNCIGRNQIPKTENYLEENAIDIPSSKYDDMKFESILGRSKVQRENNFNENPYYYESKEFHAAVDIKEEDLYNPEAFVRQNYQKGLEFCSDTNSVDKPLKYDPFKNEFSTDDHPKIIPEGLKVNLKCDCCENSFSLKSNLQRHMRIHTGEKPFKCDICEKCFAHKNVLGRHLLNHNNGEKPFECDICGKKFSRNSDLQRHMRIHTGEKPFKCDICEKCFAHKNVLGRHLLNHNNGEKPFECDICGKKFSRNSDLQRHMRIHTGEKPFKCNTCEKKFSQKSDLQTHMRIHTGENPFKCDICKKKFSQKSHLQRHMRIHTGEKPFKCDICEKCFFHKHVLKYHLLNHNGEKPFKCDICEKKFSQKSDLQRHMRIHTGEKPFK